MTQTQIILTFILYILLVLVARINRDYWAIERWKDNINNEKDVDRWHAWGFIFSAVVVIYPLLLTYLQQDWKIGLNFMFVCFTSAFFFWPAFDIGENWRRGLPWDHQGNSKTEKWFGRNILPIKFFGLVASLIGAVITMI
jgi:hypothetical protein